VTYNNVQLSEHSLENPHSEHTQSRLCFINFLFNDSKFKQLLKYEKYGSHSDLQLLHEIFFNVAK
jgi:hypothetical protein